MLFAPFIFAAHLAGSPEPLGCFVPMIAAIDSAKTRADTVALAERMLAHPPLGNVVCGDLVAGYLLGLVATEAEDDWPLRQRAMDLLNAGLRGNEDEPRLYLALGFTYYSGQRHVDADRLLGNALDHLGQARPALTRHELALLHFVRGEIYENSWRDWRSIGDFKGVISSGTFNCSSDVTTLEGFFFVCPEKWDEVMRTGWNDFHEMRRDVYQEMVDEFEAALQAEPGFRAAALSLLGEYLYERNYERAYDLARRALRGGPNDPDLLAVAGAVYHDTGRDSLAQVTFALALDRMDPAERRVYEDITPLLQRSDSSRYTNADTALGARARAAFWNSVDPLYVTPVNERRLEHYARVATVDVLFGVPTLRQRGWDTDGGQIWIRYGRPRSIWEKGIGDGGIRDVYWVYDTHGLRFAFERGLTFRRYRFSDFALAHERELKEVQPQRGDPDLTDSAIVLDRQVVRMMGRDSQPQILVYAPWPAIFHSGTTTGLTLMDEAFQPVAQWRGTSVMSNGVSAELNGLSPGQFALALEMWDPGYRTLAHVRDTVTLPSFTTFALSDILLATRIRPKSAARPASRGDLYITPVFGTTLPAGTPIGLYWETYGLTPDSSGVRRYQMSIELKRGGGDLPTRVLRGLSGIFGGNRNTTIRYEGTALGSRNIDWLELEAPVQRGEYIVHLTVTDRVTGGVTITQRSFTIQ